MMQFLKSTLITLLGVFAGIFLGFILIVVIASLVASSAMKLGSETITLKDNTILEINMDELITSSPHPQSIDKLLGMSFDTKEVTLLQMINALEMAAVNDNIKGVSLRMDGSQPLSLTAASQLRGVLQNFRDISGKPIYAYANDYSQVEYYVASVADSIAINRLGSIEWRGMAMSSLYYGELLKELNVDVEIFRPEACTYKSAVEPYYRTSMSKESRTQSQRIVDQMWGVIVNNVSQSRSLSPQTLERIAEEEVLVDAITARKSKLVTNILTDRGYNEMLERIGVQVTDQQPRTITLSELSILATEAIGKITYNTSDKIALIYAEGVIGVDKDDYTGINAKRLIRLLRKAANDKSIKGVILRVDSPGGGALDADAIALEVLELRKKKVVVVSMASVAASGGYYISAPADYIVADPFTITGSIGVYGMMLDLEKAAKKHLYIYSDGVGSAPSADFGSSFREVNAVERRAIMRGVDDVYDRFKRVVSVERKISMARVDTLSQGRIWCCEDAFAGGLVDYVGGFKSALLFGQSKIGDGEQLEIVEFADEPEGLGYLLSSFGRKVSTSLFGDSALHTLSLVEGGIITYSPLSVSM